MPIGKSEIPDLTLETLQNFVTLWQSPPDIRLAPLFSESDSPSSTIKWESQNGGRGLTPFVAPDAPAPTTAPMGIAKHSAEAAYWKEKMYFSEVFLNNLRKEGTTSDYLDSASRLAREMNGLMYRAQRRKEWMFAQMLFAGSFSYAEEKGTKISVNYSLDTNHVVSLSAADKWSTGVSKDIIGSIITGKKKIADDCGGRVDYAVCNSTVLKYLARDPAIQTLLQRSAFGQGDLFKNTGGNIVGVNPQVVAQLLDIQNLVVFDERYEMRAMLTQAVTLNNTTDVYVDNIADIVAGDTARLVDVSAGTYEDKTITSVTIESSYFTIAVTAASFKAGEDYVVVRKPFVGDTKFCMFASTVDGQKIAEYKRAPFALDRHYGIKLDSWDVKDPEGSFIRCQDKGLPILYQRDAIYILTVA